MGVNIEPDYTVRSLERALLILKLFAHGREELSFIEICGMSKLSKSTAFRLLATLEKHGFVTVNRESKYCLGNEIVRLSTLVNTQKDICNKARDSLVFLSALTKETVTLCLLEKQNLTCVDKIESENTLTITSQLGAIVPMFQGATGMAVSAFLPPEDFNRYICNEEKRLNRNFAIKDIEKKAIEVKQKGYSLSDSEVDVGVVGIAAPFFGNHGKVLGSISIVGPKIRFDFDNAEHYSTQLKAATATVSAYFLKEE